MALSEVCKNAATNLSSVQTYLPKDIGDDLGCSVMVLIGNAMKKASDRSPSRPAAPPLASNSAVT